MSMSLQVLKLDSSFKALGLISWQDAMSLTLSDKAWVVESYDHWIHSAYEKHQVPAVIVLYQYIKGEYFTVKCTRQNVYIRDEFKCQYCRRLFEVKKLSLDHVVPKSRGGQFCWENIVACCKHCNQKKAHHLPEEIEMPLLKTPKHPTYFQMLKYRASKQSSIWKQYL